MLEKFVAGLIEILFTKLYNKVIVPLLEEAVRRGKLGYDQTRGSVIVRKMKKAKEDGNEEDYNDAVDSILD